MLATVKEGRTTTSVVAAEEYTTEFRAYNDDAWYTVRVLLEGERLIVKYQNFSDENDEAFEPSRFGDCEDLEDFKERFRPLSRQLQDAECRRFGPGARVCACHSFAPDDVRFYDAVIDGVRILVYFTLSEKEGSYQSLN